MFVCFDLRRTVSGLLYADVAENYIFFPLLLKWRMPLIYRMAQKSFDTGCFNKREAPLRDFCAILYIMTLVSSANISYRFRWDIYCYGRSFVCIMKRGKPYDCHWYKSICLRPYTEKISLSWLMTLFSCMSSSLKTERAGIAQWV
jgi:hypothetical protein